MDPGVPEDADRDRSVAPRLLRVVLVLRIRQKRFSYIEQDYATLTSTSTSTSTSYVLTVLKGVHIHIFSPQNTITRPRTSVFLCQHCGSPAPTDPVPLHQPTLACARGSFRGKVGSRRQLLAGMLKLKLKLKLKTKKCRFYSCSGKE